MTARRPDAIGAHPQRRLAWARRENERRRQAYETAARTWRRRADHLDRLSMEAAGFHGCPLPGTALPVPLDDGEVVYRILPTVDLVEATARHLPGLPVPGRTLAGCLDPSHGPLPAGLRVVDSGTAVVTDRRVAFAGQNARRDWPLRDVRGLGHHPDRPVTLLHDGGAPAGLRVPAPGAANTRFYLTLAHAGATGTRQAVIEDVEALRSAHRAARPRPPRPLGPWDAPADRALPQRLAAAGVAAAAVLLGVTSAGTWTATAGQTDPAHGQATAPATTAAPPAPGVPPVATPVDPSSPVVRPTRPAPPPKRLPNATAESGARVLTTAPPVAGSPPARVGDRPSPPVEPPSPPADQVTPAPTASPTSDPDPTGEPGPTGDPSPTASSEAALLDLVGQVGRRLGLAVRLGATAQVDAALS
ncbi:hypothetical protein ACIBSS_30040 [Micromonospora aurantiaca]|uniref:hypothetical protein n=1 Tax=Micromonospora aurantiaca (nom. illeg.) TaxID=47850 RepID=UPI001F0C1798|nr:hypothetical protein [Micromonospora aurantiaca]